MAPSNPPARCVRTRPDRGIILSAAAIAGIVGAGATVVFAAAAITVVVMRRRRRRGRSGRHGGDGDAERGPFDAASETTSLLPSQLGVVVSESEGIVATRRTTGVELGTVKRGKRRQAYY